MRASHCPAGFTSPPDGKAARSKPPSQETGGVCSLRLALAFRLGVSRDNLHLPRETGEEELMRLTLLRSTAAIALAVALLLFAFDFAIPAYAQNTAHHRNRRRDHHRSQRRARRRRNRPIAGDPFCCGQSPRANHLFRRRPLSPGCSRRPLSFDRHASFSAALRAGFESLPGPKSRTARSACARASLLERRREFIGRAHRGERGKRACLHPHARPDR